MLSFTIILFNCALILLSCVRGAERRIFPTGGWLHIKAARDTLRSKPPVPDPYRGLQCPCRPAVSVLCLATAGTGPNRP